LTVSRIHCSGEEIFGRNMFECNDGHLSISGKVSFLHIHQKYLSVVGCIEGLILSLNVDLFVPRPAWSQLSAKIEDMGWNVKHTGC
jgi:hypothetical protein